jgi:hypothetical protein
MRTATMTAIPSTVSPLMKARAEAAIRRYTMLLLRLENRIFQAETFLPDSMVLGPN